jgi:hypothetical protein
LSRNAEIETIDSVIEGGDTSIKAEGNCKAKIVATKLSGRLDLGPRHKLNSY